MTNSPAAQIRLDRLLSQATDLSRKQAKQEIRKGRVQLAGERVRDPGFLVDAESTLEWQGEFLGLPSAIYLMMHKPLGLVCARSDPEHPTVMDLLPEDLAERLHIVGRLDKDTSGLLLMTDDGDWSHRISSPKHACGKVYIAHLAEPIADDAAARFAQGMLLRGETKRTRPAQLQMLDPLIAKVTLQEGRYHQVRRMFAAVGNRVEALHREAVGEVMLDATLQAGDWRELSEAERDTLAPTLD